MIEMLVIIFMGSAFFLGMHYLLVVLDKVRIIDYSNQLGGDN